MNDDLYEDSHWSAYDDGRIEKPKPEIVAFAAAITPLRVKLYYLDEEGLRRAVVVPKTRWQAERARLGDRFQYAVAVV